MAEEEPVVLATTVINWDPPPVDDICPASVTGQLFGFGGGTDAVVAGRTVEAATRGRWEVVVLVADPMTVVGTGLATAPVVSPGAGAEVTTVEGLVVVPAPTGARPAPAQAARIMAVTTDIM